MKNADKPINPVVNSDGFATSFENIDGPDGGAIGITKREYFAGLAMQGLLASFTEKASNGMWGTEVNETAKSAVDYADALLKQLENTQAD